MKIQRKLKRNANGHYCECGCGQEVTKERNRYIFGHVHIGKKFTKERNRKIGKANSIALKGRKLSNETKRKISVSLTKCRTDGYCDAWADNEYKTDCRKDYCESCRAEEIKTIIKNGKLCSNLLLHHIDFDKKNCHPDNLQTLCRSCHMKLHRLANKARENLKK